MSSTTADDGKRDLLPPSTTKLVLETSTPQSASPYPSPSSTFYPPPIPANHEFANILAANKRYRGSTPMDNSTTISSRLGSPAAPSSKVSSPVKDSAKLDPNFDSKSVNGSRRVSQEVSATPTIADQPKIRPNSAALDPQNAPAPSSRRGSKLAENAAQNEVNGNNSANSSNDTTSDPQDVTTPVVADAASNMNTLLLSSNHLEDASPTYLNADSPGASNRNSLTASLTASRPAPPSPGPSRRASLVRRGSRRSTYSNTSASRRHSTLSTSFTWADVQPLVEGVATGDTPTVVDAWAGKPIIVRDFAFPEDDERFSKRPIESLPYAERPVSQDHDRSDDEYEDDDWENEDDGYGLIASRYRQVQSSLEDENRTPLAEGHQYDEQQGGQQDEQPTELDPNAPLRPGIYRALFAFEAEGTAEMSLFEGQLVKLIGRGGGVGWAVVERNWQWEPEETQSGSTLAGETDGAQGQSANSGPGDALGEAGQALVPESYLEIFRLDPE